MSPAKRYARKQAQIITRRRLHAKERHERQQRQAQREIEALHQALHDVGLLDNLVTEIAGRWRAQKRLLGKIFGLMFPPTFKGYGFVRRFYALSVTSYQVWSRPNASQTIR